MIIYHFIRKGNCFFSILWNYKRKTHGGEWQEDIIYHSYIYLTPTFAAKKRPSTRLPSQSGQTARWKKINTTSFFIPTWREYCRKIFFYVNEKESHKIRNDDAKIYIKTELYIKHVVFLAHYFGNNKYIHTYIRTYR